MMFTLSLLALVTLAWAGRVPALKLRAIDSPVVAIALTPQANCNLEQSITTLRDFEDALGMLRGPCRFAMSRTYVVENVTRYLDQGDNPRANLVVDLQAPPGLQTFVTKIGLEPDVFAGAEYADLRVSPWKGLRGEAPSMPWFQAANSTACAWQNTGVHQLSGGAYKLDLPSACLADSSTLLVQFLYLHEPAAEAFRLKASGTLTPLESSCQLLRERSLASYEAFIDLASTLPQGCAYEYKREYTGSLEEADLFLHDGQLTVLAQPALVEPLLPGNRRQIANLRLEGVSGTTCSKSKVISRRKDVLGGSPMSSEHLLTPAINNDCLHLPLDSNVGDGQYDFLFTLPKGCQLAEPRLTFSVFDYTDGLRGEKILLEDEHIASGVKLESKILSQPGPGTSAAACSDGLEEVDYAATHQDLDSVVAALPSGCRYTLTASVSIGRLRNVKKMEEEWMLALRTPTSALDALAPTGGSSTLRGIRLQGLACGDQQAKVFAWDRAFVSWTDIAQAKLAAAKLADLSAENGIIELDHDDTPALGYVVHLDGSCIKSSADIAGKLIFTSHIYKLTDDITSVLGTPQEATPETEDSCPSAKTTVTTLREYGMYVADPQHRKCGYTLDRKIKAQIEMKNFRPPNSEPGVADARLAIRLNTSNIFTNFLPATFSVIKLLGLPADCEPPSAVQFKGMEKWSSQLEFLAAPPVMLEADGITMSGLAEVQYDDSTDHMVNLILNFGSSGCVTEKILSSVTMEVSTKISTPAYELVVKDPKLRAADHIIFDSNDDTLCPTPPDPPQNTGEFIEFLEGQDRNCKFTYVRWMDSSLENENRMRNRIAFVLPEKEAKIDGEYGVAVAIFNIEIAMCKAAADQTLFRAWTKTEAPTWYDLWATDEQLDEDSVSPEGVFSDKIRSGQPLLSALLLAPGEHCDLTDKTGIAYSLQLDGNGLSSLIPVLTDLTAPSTKPVFEKGDADLCSEQLSGVCDAAAFKDELKSEGSVHCVYNLTLDAPAALTEDSLLEDGDTTYVGFVVPANKLGAQEDTFSTRLTSVKLLGLEEGCGNANDFSVMTSEKIKLWSQRTQAKLVTGSDPQCIQDTVEFTIGAVTSGPFVVIMGAPKACVDLKKSFSVEIKLFAEGKGAVQRALATNFDIASDPKGKLTSSTQCYLPAAEMDYTELSELMPSRWDKCSYTLSRDFKASWPADNWAQPLAAFLPPQLGTDLKPKSEILNIRIPVAADRFTECQEIKFHKPKKTKLMRSIESWSHLREAAGADVPPDMAQALSDDWEVVEDLAAELVTENGETFVRITAAKSASGDAWDKWVVLEWPMTCLPDPVETIYASVETTLQGLQSDPRTATSLNFPDMQGKVTSSCYVEHSEETFSEFVKSLDNRSKTCTYNFTQTRTTQNVAPYFEKPNYFLSLPKLPAEDLKELELKSLSLTGLSTADDCSFKQMLSSDEAQNLDKLGGNLVKGFTQISDKDNMVLQYDGSTSLFGEYLTIADQGSCDDDKTAGAALEIAAAGLGKSGMRTPKKLEYKETKQTVTNVGAYCSDFSSDDSVKSLDAFKEFLKTKSNMCVFDFALTCVAANIQHAANLWHMPNDQSDSETRFVFSTSIDSKELGGAGERYTGDYPQILKTMNIGLSEDSCGSPSGKALAAPAAGIDLDHYKTSDLDYDLSESGTKREIILQAKSDGSDVSIPDWVLVSAGCKLVPANVSLHYAYRGQGLKESTNPTAPLRLLAGAQPQTKQTDCQVDQLLGSNDFAYFLTGAKVGCRYTLLQEFGGNLCIENLFITAKNQVGIAFEIPARELRSQPQLYETSLQSILVEVAESKCDISGAKVAASFSRPTPLNDDLYKDAEDITDHFDITLKDKNIVQLSPKKGVALDVERTSMIMTLSETCNPNKDLVAITFTVFSEGEGISVQAAASTRHIGLLSASIGLLLALML